MKRILSYFLYAFAFLSVLFILVRVSMAQSNTPFTKFPSTPIQIFGPQGRPIPDAVATVTDTNGVAVTVYTDRTGATAYSSPFVVPTTGIVQFFADADIYIVSVTGSGVTRTFYVTAGGGLPPSTRFISIDRTAPNFELNTTSPGVLSCPTDTPCYVILDDDTNRSFRVEWINPTFEISLDSFLISLTASDGNNGNLAAFEIRWCTYGVGEAVCTPANAVDRNVSIGADGRRVDLLLSSDVITTTWDASDHVIFEIFRDVADADDSVVGEVRVNNVRFEFERD